MCQEKNVTLEEILDARERRAERQARLTALFRCPLLSMTLNLPGRVKRTPLSSYYFHESLRRLKARLKAMGAAVAREELTAGPTGDESVLAVTGISALTLKKLAVSLEECSDAGRLLDLDVIDGDGAQVKRSFIGKEPRSCLLCEKAALICGRSRAHPVEELAEKAWRMLEQAVFHSLAGRAVSMACRASSFELLVSPKPGLVTPYDSGSHRDMDRFTFARSQAALLRFYEDAFRAGWEGIDNDDAILRFRLEGMDAEAAMLEATDGINAHRGWIYTAGILLAAGGALCAAKLKTPETFPVQRKKGPEGKGSVSVSIMSDTAARISRALEQALASPFFEGVRGGMAEHVSEEKTAALRSLLTPDACGETGLVSSSGTGETGAEKLTGIRREAVLGFPCVFEIGLPIMTRALNRGEGENLAGQRALVALLAAAEDTTLIRRGGISLARRIRSAIQSALGCQNSDSPEALVSSALAMPASRLQSLLDQLSACFCDQGLSCGGAADLLAGSCLVHEFIHFLVINMSQPGC